MGLLPVVEEYEGEDSEPVEFDDDEDGSVRDVPLCKVGSAASEAVEVGVEAMLVRLLERLEVRVGG